MSPRARRALFTLVLFFSVCAVVGTMLQRKVGAQTATDESQLRDNLKSFTDVYSLVEKNYAEPLAGDKADTAIYDGAIPGMLRVLDPHSNFYDPKAYARLREDQRGHYYGVGMVIQQQRDPKARTTFLLSRRMKEHLHSGLAFILVTRFLQSTARARMDGLQTRWRRRSRGPRARTCR